MTAEPPAIEYDALSPASRSPVLGEPVTSAKLSLAAGSVSVALLTEADSVGGSSAPIRWMVRVLLSFFLNDTATTEIYTLSLHDALPISLMALASATKL